MDRRFRAVLFDFGETLFTRAGGPQAIVEVARDLGRSITLDDAAQVWARIQARAVTPAEVALARDLSAEAHRREWTRLYSEADVFTAGIGASLYEREITPACWHPYPDAIPVLTALARAGIKIGVVSDTGWDIRPVFELHGLLHFIDTFALSCEHGAVKPGPELFEVASAALGIEPAATLMIGDNPFADGGAARAGMTALILPAVRPGEPRGLDAVLALTETR